MTQGEGMAALWLLPLLVCCAAARELLRDLEVSEGVPIGTRIGFIGDGTSGSSGPPYLIVTVPGSGVDSDLAVEETTGEIRTKVSLDRETRSSYSLVAIPRSGENVRVSVRVLDENDNAPTFPSLVMHIEFPENTPRDVKRTLYPARDLDLGIFNTQRYSIVSGNVNNAFRLSSHRERDGVLYLDLQINGFLDRETTPSYSLVIEALDGGTPPLRGSMTVNITIQDVNDNQPIFNQSRYFATVPENATVGTSVLQVFATDTDSGENGQVEYSINRRQSDREKMFDIDTNTGLVIVNRPLDFETKEVHELVIVARDHGVQPLETTAFVSIRVTDVNDNQPTINVIFLSDDATPKISESALPGEFVARISVNDPDSKTDYSNSNVTVSLQGGEGHFGLESRDNFIYLVIVSMPIDRELRPNYTLSVVATDTGSPPLHASKTFHLRVTDINDNAPEFEMTTYNANVLEVADPGTSVFQVVARDKDEGDNSILTYAILDSPETHAQWFQIDSRSGLITTKAHVDCETDPVPLLTITATDSGTPRLSSTATVSVTIHDVNDNEPIFDQTFYNVSVPESEAIGHCILKVSATDPDCGVNAIVNYTVGEGAIRMKEFQINSTSGEICIVASLDFENRESYEFPVVATDRGGLSTTAIIKIQVADINDNRPIFYPREYNVSLSENGNIQSSSQPVAVVVATDRDSGKFGTVTYRIVAGNNANLFRIDRKTGEIFLTRPNMLSTRSQPYHKLNVSATDGAGLKSAQDAEVFLSVTDASRRPPVFERPRYTFTVREDVDRNALVGTVKASSHGPGPREPVRYAIYSGDPDSYFSIDPDLGVIRTAGHLDHEVHKSVLLNVQAMSGDPPTYAHAQVNIVIDDVNDNSPEFDSATVRISVPENVELGSPLYEAHAKDKDSGENSIIRYRLADSSASGLFAIDPRLGHLTLLRPLDYELSQRHTLIVAATDTGVPSLSSNLTVHVDVQDVNDNTPMFEQAEYAVSVLESVPVNSQIVHVTAIDNDTGNNARLTYRLKTENTNDSEIFGIFPNSGLVYLKRPLDRETRDRYVLTVGATDNGTPADSTSARVVVTVLDANDNNPTFDKTSYEFAVEENQSPGAVVGRISAVDPDLDNNAVVRYSFIPGNFSFRINPATGEITTRQPLDREVRASYELVAEARDQGVPPRSTWIAVHIAVLDVNDNAPELVDPREDVISVREQQPPGTEVTRLRAVDRDHGSNATITYSILKGRDSDGYGVFSVDPMTGSIRTRAVLDHEERTIYRLAVAATDGGTPPKQTVRPLRVEVLDLSDHRPTFTSSSLLFKVKENARVGHVVGGVATSSDLLDNTISGRGAGSVRYTLTSATPRNPYGSAGMDDGTEAFEIDKSSGVLVVSKSLDRETQAEYRLEVRALDTSASNNPQSSAVTVRVEVEDINDNAPVWPQNPVVIELLEDTPTSSVVSNVTATDADAGANSDLRYNLVKAFPESSTFSVDTLTGIITLNAALDYENISQYILVILATDQAANTSKRLATSATFIIKIIDVNDNAPVFISPSSKSLTITDRTLPGAVIGKVIAVDKDSGENGRVRYSLSDSRFVINPDSGVLSLAADGPTMKVATFVLNVTASDYGRPAARSVMSLRIVVRGSTDNPPKFLKSTYYASIAEDVSAGTFVVRLEAAVPGSETDHRGNLTYRIPPGVAGDKFTVDPTKGTVTTRGLLDRETQDFYSVPVYISEKEQRRPSDVAIVQVTVLDVNDHEPTFRPGACYPLRVPENSELAVIHKVVASDLDTGAGGEVTYSITSGNAGNKFSIDLHSGLLSARPLDREAHAKYNLVITAQDRGSPPLQGSCNVPVIVDDANDNDPQFSQPRYTAHLSEDTPLDTAVLTVQAVDADIGINAKVVYSLANESHWLFKIDNKTGVISTSGYFDREIRSVYDFQVVATDGGRYDARSQKVPVQITIIDVNDNEPVFAAHPFTTQTPAYTPAGTSLVTVQATDADLGTNAEILYSFVNEAPNSKFKINPTTGVVTASNSLSADAGRLFHLEVLARDRGNPPQSATGLVEVRVGDYSDTATLRCHNATYRVRLPENASPGREVVQISAGRLDGRRQKIRYDFARGSYDGAFSIHADSGLVRVRDRSPLDYETVHNFSLTVMAEADNTLFGYCDIQVVLDDQNDNAPRFTQEQYSASVWEGNNKGTFVMQVSATDVDDGQNAHILYHIVDGNHDNAFVIEPPFSGLIKTNIVLDREIRDTYRLTIIATDEGTPQLTGTTTLRINIVDANDNQPTFPPHSIISVSEGAELGSVLTVVTANDVDTNPALTYSFADGTTTTPEFSIDRFSGKITLGRHLDFETRGEYSLAITASDTAHTANTTLTIRVTDVNDNKPAFRQPSYHASLPEGNSDANFSVLQVNATDADSGKNAEIQYSLLNAIKGVSIDPSTGIIYVNRSALQLPDGMKDIELNAVAQDLGVPPLTSSVPVFLRVSNERGQAPHFTQEEYQIRIREDSPRGTIILKVAAVSSRDVALTEFSILSGNEEGIFQILSPSGEIVLLKETDREKRSSYALHVTAGGNNATVFVSIDDANDNAPVFQGIDATGGYSVEVSESLPVGSPVLTLTANDTDLLGGPNTELWFEILAGNDAETFVLETRTGVLRVKNVLDADSGRAEHFLIVRVSDSATAPDHPLSSVTRVTVKVSDENDNAPKFPVKEYLETVAENEPIGASVFTARAVDLDVGVYGRVNYSIVPNDEDCWKLFRVDHDSGVVFTNVVFDYEKRDRCSFTLRAEDYGGTRTEVRVRVEIESRDEFHPQFTERTYKFFIPPPSSNALLPLGYVIGSVQATDRDKGPDGRVVYMLTTQQTYFKVNRTTGAIMVKKKLDHSGLDVSFIVTASSGKQGSLTNTTVVEIVIDPLAEPGTNLASNTTIAASGGLADWALGLLIALILIVLVFGGVFLFLHMRNRRHKKVNKPALASGAVGNDGFVDPGAFDTIPIRGTAATSQFAPPKYDEIPPYRNTSSSGAATTSELSGSEQSGSSGRGSAEDGEDVEDEEIRMINEGPLQRDGIHRTQLDEDNISDVSVHNTQEYLARLGIVDNPETAPHPVDQLHLFDEEGAAEADLTNLIYAKLKDVGAGSERGSNDDTNLSATVDHVILGGFDVPVGGVGTQQPSMTGSLSSIVHSEEELTGSYNWDYLLDWGPQYQPLAHVFSEIARLKDDTASVQSTNSGSTSSKGKGPAAVKTLPPPLLTSVAPRSIAAPAIAPRGPRTSHHSALPRSPISHDPSGFSTSTAMSPSFSPSLSPLATRSPSISPLVSPGHIPRPAQRATIAETELRI